MNLEQFESTIRCTCTDKRSTYATTHAGYCARVTAPEALRAILDACAHLAEQKGAVYWQQGDSLSDMYVERPFAALLREVGA